MGRGLIAWLLLVLLLVGATAVLADVVPVEDAGDIEAIVTEVEPISESEEGHESLIQEDVLKSAAAELAKEKALLGDSEASAAKLVHEEKGTSNKYDKEIGGLKSQESSTAEKIDKEEAKLGSSSSAPTKTAVPAAPEIPPIPKITPTPNPGVASAVSKAEQSINAIKSEATAAASKFKAAQSEIATKKGLHPGGIPPVSASASELGAKAIAQKAKAVDLSNKNHVDTNLENRFGHKAQKAGGAGHAYTDLHSMEKAQENKSKNVKQELKANDKASELQGKVKLAKSGGNPAVKAAELKAKAQVSALNEAQQKSQAKEAKHKVLIASEVRTKQVAKQEVRLKHEAKKQLKVPKHLPPVKLAPHPPPPPPPLHDHSMAPLGVFLFVLLQIFLAFGLSCQRAAVSTNDTTLGPQQEMPKLELSIWGIVIVFVFPLILLPLATHFSSAVVMMPWGVLFFPATVAFGHLWNREKLIRADTILLIVILLGVLVAILAGDSGYKDPWANDMEGSSKAHLITLLRSGPFMAFISFAVIVIVFTTWNLYCLTQAGRGNFTIVERNPRMLTNYYLTCAVLCGMLGALCYTTAAATMAMLHFGSSLWDCLNTLLLVIGTVLLYLLLNFSFYKFVAVCPVMPFASTQQVIQQIFSMLGLLCLSQAYHGLEAGWAVLMVVAMLAALAAAFRFVAMTANARALELADQKQQEAYLDAQTQQANENIRRQQDAARQALAQEEEARRLLEAQKRKKTCGCT